jgi:hypothetical protein
MQARRGQNNQTKFGVFEPEKPAVFDSACDAVSPALSGETAENKSF